MITIIAFVFITLHVSYYFCLFILFPFLGLHVYHDYGIPFGVAWLIHMKEWYEHLVLLRTKNRPEADWTPRMRLQLSAPTDLHDVSSSPLSPKNLRSQLPPQDGLPYKCFFRCIDIHKRHDHGKVGKHCCV